MSLAENALFKYPNASAIVYQSAMLYHLTMEQKHQRRAIELFERACALLEQNTDERISLVSIQNKIEQVYLQLGEMDAAIALLKRTILKA